MKYFSLLLGCLLFGSSVLFGENLVVNGGFEEGRSRRHEHYSGEAKAKGLVYYSCREPGGEFCELRAYLPAKLMWNPQADPQSIVNDFLDGFYGPASGRVFVTGMDSEI